MPVYKDSNGIALAMGSGDVAFSFTSCPDTKLPVIIFGEGKMPGSVGPIELPKDTPLKDFMDPCVVFRFSNKESMSALVEMLGKCLDIAVEEDMFGDKIEVQ